MDKKEAIKILKEFHDKTVLFSVRTALETVIHELQESDDEKIRQEILFIVKQKKEEMGNHLGVRGMSYDDMIDWLEKQVEQTSIDGVELKDSEDERIRKTLIEFYTVGAKNNEITCGIADKDILAWLEKQQRINQWSNKDSSMVLTLTRDIEQISFISTEGKNERIKWLNSLEERY